MYSSDNRGFFHIGLGGESATGEDRWPVVLRRNYADIDMRLCPMATKPLSEGGQTPYAAWGRFEKEVDEYRSYDSYGFNEWLCNRGANSIGGEIENYWGNIYNIRGTHRIPLFFDCYWYDVWPHEENNPPRDREDTVGRGTDEMKRVCLDRHSQAINGIFLDWSARKIDLKELWVFKWHRNYDTSGPWTMAGGVTPERWPGWMQGMPDY